MSEGLNTPSPCSSAPFSVPRPSARPPSTLSEWQLLAVLHRANLVQYYDTFISQGGDDVHQIMGCAEDEFMEIMSLVGMVSKPLHVRRLQRTLTDFSADQAAFTLTAIQQIGPPPAGSFGLPDSMQLFLPSVNGVASSSPGLLISSSLSPSQRPSEISHLPSLPLSIGATANILAGDVLAGLGDKSASSSSPIPSPVQHDDFVALGDFDPNADGTGEPPTLSDAQVSRLTQCSHLVVAKLPQYKPKLIQNKKKISKELLDLMTMPHTDRRRVEEFRKYAAIYGRFDTKRKADKALTLHEVSVNEAAAQICMLVPALLTRRDELFAFARQVVKDAGYHYVKTNMMMIGSRRDEASSSSSTSTPLRKRHSSILERESLSPRSCNSTSPTLGVSTTEEEGSKRAKASSEPVSKSSFALEQWAADRIAASTAKTE